MGICLAGLPRPTLVASSSPAASMSDVAGGPERGHRDRFRLAAHEPPSGQFRNAAGISFEAREIRELRPTTISSAGRGVGSPGLFKTRHPAFHSPATLISLDHRSASSPCQTDICIARLADDLHSAPRPQKVQPLSGTTTKQHDSGAGRVEADGNFVPTKMERRCFRARRHSLNPHPNKEMFGARPPAHAHEPQAGSAKAVDICVAGWWNGARGPLSRPAASEASVGQTIV